MRNLHNILLQEDGIEARHLFRLWEKLRIRASEYKNHRIFTLRCLHNNLIPVSIKLKSTIKSTRANKILRKAEKDLLQARIKTINFILDNTSKQLEECRAKLVAIISTQRLRECQDFVDKVSEIRFNKVKQRQLNKFNLLTIRKEGNITRSITNLNYHNLNSQTNSQVNSTPQASPPSREDNRSSQAGPPQGEASTSLPSSQANSQAREGGAPPQTGTGTGTPLLGKTAVFPRLPTPPSPRLVLPRLVLPLPGKMAAFPRPIPPPSPRPVLPRLALPLAGKTAVFPWPLPPPSPRLALSRQALPLPGKTTVFPRVLPLPPLRPVLSCPHQKAADLLICLVPKQVYLAIITTLLGKVAGAPLGIGPPRPPRRSTPPPRKATILSPPTRHPQGSSKEEPNPKWVINLSNKPLTPAQRSLLAKGPNFAVTPRQPPNLEYITAIEAACTKLSQQDAEELRANINRVLRSSHPPKPNLTKAQMSALRELKRDRDCIVLTADKGVAMVVMDRQDYINKANHLLNQNTYKTITKDPTNSIKNKLINILKTIKTKSGLGTSTYKSMYPTGCVPPKFYGLPKIHKPDTPLRPRVSSCGSVTYGVAKELAKILKPLVGQSPHHINSTQDFVEQAKHFKLESGECLSSYDVSALFTSVPIDPALNIIKDLLVKDNTLKERTVMDVEDIILLLEFCLKNTYFSFQGQFYEQVEGAAMGSPVSPIVANLYMEYLEQKALSTAPHPPGSGAGM